MTITDEEHPELTSSLFTEQKGSSDLPPETLQGHPQRTNCSDSSLATTNCHSTAVLPKWGFISKETHRQKDKDNSHIVEKPPKRKNSRIPEFQDTPSTDSFTYSRSHSLVLVPITPAPVPLQRIHLKPKRGWPAANGSLWTSKWREQPARSTLGTAEVPLVPLRSHSFLSPLEKPEQTHPEHWPHRTEGLIPQIFDKFPGKMMMWEGRKLVFTAQEDLPISSCSQGVFYLSNLQRRYWCGMSAASWQRQTELRPDYSTLDGTDTQFQWCYFDPASHEPIIRIQKF